LCSGRCSAFTWPEARFALNGHVVTGLSRTICYWPTPGAPVKVFAAGSLTGAMTADLFDRMLDPKTVGIGTSTPKADPGGDYAWMIFARGGRQDPGG
jgi:ABC-type molybdate transport system substrate-binding protein